MRKCACTKDKCDGICRDTHLHRKRGDKYPKDRNGIQWCPASYEDKNSREF